MAETWEIAVYFSAMIIYVILAMYLFYRTSDEYKLKRKRRELGYTDDSVSVWQVCCALCIGPINRKRWESKHKYFRTDSYGSSDSKWMVVGHPSDPNQGWQKLPRGDTDFVKSVTSKAVAKIIIKVLEDEYNAALYHAVDDWQNGMSSDVKHREISRVRQKTANKSKAELLQMVEKQTKRESMWQIEEEQAEEKIAVVASSTPFDKMRKHDIAVMKRRNSKEGMVPPATNSPKLRKGNEHRPALSNVVTVQQLRKLVSAMDADSLEEEHLSIPLNITSPQEYPANRAALNRSDDMAPNKHTRVSLECPKNISFNTDYINANFIRGEDGKIGKYIVTQAPLSGHENGKKNTREHFWTMVWNYQVPTIVMLMRPSAAHCPFYWPSGKRHKFVDFGPFTVTFITRDESPGIVRTELALSCEGSNAELIVNHYMYKGWPATGIPQGSTGILTLLRKVGSVHRGPEPIIVHDEFGDGASGVFVAADHCITTLKRSARVDVLKTVAKLRQDRGGLVKDLEQYQFLYKLLAVYSATNKVGRSERGALPPKYNAPPKYRKNSEERKFDSIMDTGKTSDPPTLAIPRK